MTGPGRPLPPETVRQQFCLERGVYTVEMRLAMLPTGRKPVDGRIWLAMLAPGEPARLDLLMEFEAEPRVPTFQAGSMSLAVGSFTCFALRYDATGPARIDPAPGKTTFAIRG